MEKGGEGGLVGEREKPTVAEDYNQIVSATTGEHGDERQRPVTLATACKYLPTVQTNVL